MDKNLILATELLAELIIESTSMMMTLMIPEDGGMDTPRIVEIKERTAYALRKRWNELSIPLREVEEQE